MSALGQKRTCAVHDPMSALPPKADMCSALGDVRFGPKADMCGAKVYVLLALQSGHRGTCTPQYTCLKLDFMRAPLPPDGSVLLLIDLQKAIDHPSWGERNNLSAETNIARLLAHWRSRDWPVWHVKHDSTQPNSHYRQGEARKEVKTKLRTHPGGTLLFKNNRRPICVSLNRTPFCFRASKSKSFIVIHLLMVVSDRLEWFLTEMTMSKSPDLPPNPGIYFGLCFL